MAEYPSNSNKSKEEQKIPAPVVNSIPTARKKKPEKKLFRMIFAQDFKDIKQGLIKDWIEPQVRNLAWNYVQFLIDTVKNGVKMMMYDNYKPTEKSNIPASNYSYSNYYKPAVVAPRPNTESVSYDEFEYPTEKEAADVLNGLRDLIARCKAASVLDLYGLSHISTSNYTLQNWGWTNLDFVEIRTTTSDDGRIVYYLTLPKATMLQR